jgi:translation initiation factor IF-2
VGVVLLNKTRVYELAKELNTTSKRLIEKLSEIDIKVKNHMSYLEADEIQALYKHIGMMSNEEDKDKDKDKAEQEKKTGPAMSKDIASSIKQENKKTAEKKDEKTIRKGPRIIRKTEIVINTKDEENYRRQNGNNGQKQSIGRTSKKKKSYGRKRDFVKIAADTSGLRTGFIRDTSAEYIMEQKLKKIKAQNKGEKQELDEKKDIQVVSKAEAVQQKEKKSDISDTKIVKDSSASAKSEIKPHKNTAKKGTEVEIKENKSEKKINGKSIQKNKVYKKDTIKTKKEHKKDTGKNTRFQKTKDGEKTSNRKDSGKTRQTKSVSTTLEIPKPEYTDAEKEELNSQTREIRREYHTKDQSKGLNRELKKENTKNPSIIKRKRKFRPENIIIGEKKQVSEILSDDSLLEQYDIIDDMVKIKKVPKIEKSEKQKKHIPHKAVLTHIKIGENITVKELAETLKRTVTEVIKKLMMLDIMVTQNEVIDFDTASLIAEEFGVKTEKEKVVNEEDILFDDFEEENKKDLKPRPPVVVVMGHVDHGKTLLLDVIKETNVIDDEAGGITQHIGAYMVEINGRKITFLDTPGHEAFTAMRARGAKVTDIAILVVAADDGVMPQTIEAINHAKAANVSIIVAVNKIDKPGANPERVKQQLTEHGLVPEEWGGDVIFVEVSAKKKQNIDQLLEMILLTADILELKANPSKQAKGTIIEAKLDKGKGPVATLLVQRGIMKTGDSIITGTSGGRIRAMMDDRGNIITKANPSTPVEITGLSEVPEAGELFYVIEDEKVARQLIDKRKTKQREEHYKASSTVSLDDLFNKIQKGEVKELNLIIKADVQGSVEAVRQSLEKLNNEEVKIKVIHGGVGAITESDVTLAEVSNAIIIGFNVRPVPNVKEIADNANVDIRLYRVIYNAIEDVQSAMKGLLDPEYKEKVFGHTEVRQIFKVSGVGTIGGSYVTDGKIIRNSEARVVRDGIVVYEGNLGSLKRFKDDVKEVSQGYECGISMENFNDIKEGDVIECFTMQKMER